MSALVPIAADLWTAEPRLIGGRGTDGRIRFPMPVGDAATGFEPVPLSLNGTLWSWTIQNFEPKRPPYQGPVPFQPYMVGYVELPSEVIIAARIVDVAEPCIGMPLALRIVPFDDARSTYAFGPIS
jgi:uncharacterized OB-fold protein